jgi:signal transduction histidine kinase
MKSTIVNRNKQKKRLRWILLLFFVAPSIPVYYLLQTVYTQLENEAYFTARHQAETLVNQIELKLKDILETEQNRPIAEYQFFNVMENPLLSETAGVKFSPLSELPPKTEIKGLVGYFQINTDGSFHLPALPELGQDSISGLSLAELESRLKLKHKLRDLLSNKIIETKRTRAKDLNQGLKSNAEIESATPQPYIEEVKQQHEMGIDYAESMASMEDSLSSNEQLKSKLDKTLSVAKKSGLLKKFKPSKKYKTRKEIVQLPDQTMASSYFNRSKENISSVQSLKKPFGDVKKESVLGQNKTSVAAINFFSFESEVTPLQLLLIGQDYFCFYRYVWHDNSRYTQGFIVKNNVFLTTTTQALIESTAFSHLLFSSEKGLLLKIKVEPSEKQYQLYNRKLSTPFQKLEITVNAPKLQNVPGELLIDLLVLSIYGIFLLGFIAFYHLGSRQIDLVKQQQNFISAVSHELKTPLTSIRMYGEMLRSGWVKDESDKQKYYDFIFFESERLSRLITNVLHIARIGHQQHNSKIITISAHSLFKRISSKVGVQIESSLFKLKLIDSTDKSESMDIKVDEDAFFQIIINLVDNAIKFSDGSDIKQIDIGLTCSKNHQQAIFYIRDYGPGIKNNQLKKIFQLFYRPGDEHTRTTSGTGIGLALVMQLAETMKAKVMVINKHPGAEFQLKIPLV